MTLVAGTRLGPYEIIQMLGAGGMGEVYRARDSRLERDVAVKVLPDRYAKDPQALARFGREAKAVAALSHPNILAIYDTGTHEGVTYAVTELLTGQTLAKRIKHSPLHWQAALEIAVPIAEGLATAHTKGIVHRDIKPENVFLTEDGGLRILDFGLARLEDQSKPPDASPTGGTAPTVGLVTRPGIIMGTVAYMSPEQVRGQPADTRSDVFSFGCMLFEMLCGQRPFARSTDADTMAATLTTATPLLAESATGRPIELDRVIARCLEKNPGARFDSARELSAALREIVRRFPLEGSGLKGVDTQIGDITPGSGARLRHAGPSVAVLPLVNLSSDPENEFFTDGLAEELITVLSKLEGLRVASRTSAFAFKGKHEDVRRIGQQLNVQTVLEGSVRKAGNRLRISAQLVNVADGYQLWSETYNRQLEDIFQIQDEIAQNIAKSLRLILSEKDKRAIDNAATTDVQAYEYYLRGRRFFHQFRKQGIEFARQMFAHAIDIDPGYARAYAGLADCYSLLYSSWDASEENRRQADEASRKALELDNDSADAHTARGMALSLFGRHDVAREEFQTAIRLDPQLYEAHYLYARTCVAQGKLAEAAEAFQQATRLRPDDYQSLLLNASVLQGLKREADCEAAYRHGLRAAEKHLEVHPDDARALYLGAAALQQSGEASRASEWAGRALAIDPDGTITLYNVACLYSQQGRADEAVDCLERAVEHGHARNWKSWIENDLDLAPLRGHPRFQALLARIT